MIALPTGVGVLFLLTFPFFNCNFLFCSISSLDIWRSEAHFLRSRRGFLFGSGGHGRFACLQFACPVHRYGQGLRLSGTHGDTRYHRHEENRGRYRKSRKKGRISPTGPRRGGNLGDGTRKGHLALVQPILFYFCDRTSQPHPPCAARDSRRSPQNGTADARGRGTSHER